jgi:hypothetical protein
MNPDFRDLLGELSTAGADFLVVGAYALAAHGLSRATGDLDIWVRPTEANALRVWKALARFGAPTESLSIADLHNPDVVFRMGLPPNQIDILTSISGVEFNEAWSNRATANVSGITVAVIGRLDQIRNKRATDRPKDKLDADWLERHPPENP